MTRRDPRSRPRRQDGFAAVETRDRQSRPAVAVIGELYLMLNRTSNLELVRAVERSGGEVVQGTFSDWLYFVDWRRKDGGPPVPAVRRLRQGARSPTPTRRPSSAGSPARCAPCCANRPTRRWRRP